MHSDTSTWIGLCVGRTIGLRPLVLASGASGAGSGAVLTAAYAVQSRTRTSGTVHLKAVKAVLLWQHLAGGLSACLLCIV